MNEPNHLSLRLENSDDRVEIWMSVLLVGKVGWIDRMPLGLMRDPNFIVEMAFSASQIHPLVTSMREFRICQETYHISVAVTVRDAKAYSQKRIRVEPGASSHEKGAEKGFACCHDENGLKESEGCRDETSLNGKLELDEARQYGGRLLHGRLLLCSPQIIRRAEGNENVAESGGAEPHLWVSTS